MAYVGQLAMAVLRHPTGQVLFATWFAALAGLAAWYLMWVSHHPGSLLLWRKVWWLNMYIKMTNCGPLCSCFNFSNVIIAITADRNWELMLFLLTWRLIHITPPPSPPAILLCYLHYADPAPVHLYWTQHVQIFSSPFLMEAELLGCQFPVKLHLMMQICRILERQANRWMLTMIQEF